MSEIGDAPIVPVKAAVIYESAKLPKIQIISKHFPDGVHFIHTKGLPRGKRDYFPCLNQAIGLTAKPD